MSCGQEMQKRAINETTNRSERSCFKISDFQCTDNLKVASAFAMNYVRKKQCLRKSSMM